MSKLLKWLKQWSYKLKTMLKHENPSMILGFTIDPDLVCRRYENRAWRVGCAFFYKPIWQLTVNERGHYADSEDTFLFKIEDSPDTRLGA